jgi:hypothetical protein
MDTMRRFLFCLTALGLLGAFLGCHCTTGVCDCDPWHSCHQCGYGGCGKDHNGGPGGSVVTPAPVVTPGGLVKPEVIQQPPKEDMKEEMKKDKDAPPAEKEEKGEPVMLK